MAINEMQEQLEFNEEEVEVEQELDS